MAKSRRRAATRRVPTQYTTYTPTISRTLLNVLTGPVSPGVFEYTGSYQNRYFKVPKKRQLAKTQKTSTFPKTYGVATPVLTKRETKVLDVCESRRERTQVLHALNKAGKVGQKRPIWTKKSKVRC